MCCHVPCAATNKFYALDSELVSHQHVHIVGVAMYRDVDRLLQFILNTEVEYYMCIHGCNQSKFVFVSNISD